MAEYLVTLSLLIMILLVVRGLFRKSISPTVMYALWLVVVVRLCLPFSLFQVEVDLPAWQEEIPQEQQGQHGAADPGIDPDTITPPVADTPSVPDTPSVIIPTTPSLPSVPTVPAIPENPTVPGEDSLPDIPHIPDVPVTPEVPPAPPAPIDWMRVAVTVWIAGSAVLALWFAITGIVYHHRLITHRTLYKTLRKTKVYLTEDESAPCLAGVVPAIYIPPVEMDEDARAFIVLHEYMHLRHGDHVWALVRILALIVHWWNPLVWAAVILSKRDAELACDHAVAAQLNRENRLEYARILLDTIPQKHRYAVGLGSAPMKERILRLTKTQKNRILCVVLAVIITAAAVGCSFVHLTEKESPEEPPAFDFDLDTLCRHIADGDLSALDLFDASNEEFLQGQFNALHAYYSGTAEKAGGDWEAMPEGGVALPGELSFKNCEKFEYSTASQTPVVLRYDVGDCWLYAAFTLLDVGTTGDVSEILWHLSEAWFIPQSDAVEASVADLAEWKVYSYFQNVGYTEWKTLKFYNQVTGESDYFSAAAGIKITSLQYSGGKVFVECDSHGFLIFDLTGGLYECLSTNKDTYIAYKNEYGAYIPGSGRWQSDSRLQARGEKGTFVVTLFDGKYSLADASLSESEILEIWQYNVGNAQKNNNAPQYHVPYGKLLNQVGSHVLDLFVMKGQAYLEARQAYDEEAATVPWLVYMIRALDVSREEITSALQKDYVPYTDAIVDALFSEDDGRINETFHSPLALCHEGKVYTAYDLSLKITDVDSEEQKAFVRSIPKEDIIDLIRAIQARDAMHGVVTPGEIVKLIYRLKDITLTAPGDEYAYGSYCYVHGMAYHSYPSALTDALDRDAFNAWHEESQWHTRENGCPFPQSNIYEFIHHFNIPKSRFVELYNERTIDDDYPIDLLYGGTAEAVDAYYRTSDPEKELESIKWANLRELKMHINAYIRDELHIQMKTSHCSLAELMYMAGIKAEELSSYYSKGHAVSPENRYDTIFDYDPAAVGYTTDASFEKVLARYTAYYLDCAICGLTPYDTPYDRQVSEMQNGSFTDKSLPDNFAEFYHEAERVYALFTGYRANIYTEGKFSNDGADYQAVDIDGCTTMAGLRALCEQYFNAALTDKLLSTTVMNQYPLYREHNGKLYRFSGYVAQFGYDIGKSYRMSSVKTENGAQTVRVSAVWYEGERQISTEVSCAYTTLENEEIRFTSFSLMAQALSNAWANYSDYMLLTQSDYNGISLYYRADDPDESMAENFFIRFGGREAYISTTTSAWLRYTWEPQLYCIDMELPGMQKDGIEDAVVIFTTGTGTGVHTEEAYVLSGADGTLHSFTEPYTVIENAASRDNNGKTWIVDAFGKQIGFPDNAYFDEHFKFYIEDGCLGAKVSIGYGMLQYLESYFRVKYGESGVIWEYAGGEEPRSQGPFVGYVADKTTPWIDLYTEKNGTYVGRIPYEIFHDWIATDRDKDTWTPGWMGEYVCFYYAEFGDFCWAAAHLRDTVLGSGRKNVATSADGGKTWDIGSTRDNYGGNHVVGMGFATDKIAFISYDPYNEHDGADGPVISRTTDGGKTWKLLDVTVPDSLGGQKLIAGIPFYDGDLLRYPVWLNPSHGSREGEPMYLISRDKGMTWEWEKDSTSGTASLSGVLSCILRGEDAFYDTAAKQRVFLTDWLKTNEMSVSKYSVIDLNGDGAPELVLWLNRGTNEYVGFLVLYDKNTTVYAHLLYYREFSDLKEDGTFDFSSGVSNHGIGRIDFEGDTYTIRKLAYCESVDNQNVSYFLENKSVTKQAFDAYENAQNSKPDAIWVDCSIEAAPGYKQYTPAIDIDTAKLDYVKPMAMYGESRPGANFDRTANIHPGTGSEGYADGVGYITFGVCNDRKSPDYVSRYYTYRVTSAGGYIISVEEAETITRDIVLKKGKPYTGSLEGRHTCVVNNRYYGIAISGDTISASVGRYQTDAGGTGKGTYTYDPATGEMTVTTITKYHDGNGNLLVNPPKTVTGKLYEYGDMVHFLYDDEKATPLPLSFPKINAFPPDRTDFIFDDLAGEWYHSFRDAAGDQFYCLALDPETQQIRFDHGFYDGSYAARYVGTYRVDYNRIIHATLQDNNNPSGGEMKFVFSMGYSMGRDETGEMRTTINITPQVCDMENYRPMLGRYFGFKREKATAEELTELAEQYNFVMSAYEKAAEAASWFRTASLVEAGEADGKDSIEYDGRRYYRVTKFDTYADLRQYLGEWFSASLVDQLLNDQSVASYISHNGKLYATPGMVPQNIRLGERYYSGGKVKDDWYSLDVTVEVLDTKDLTTVLAYQSFQFDYQYKNGKWVFTQFPHIQ